MDTFLNFVIFIFGLVVGSFLNCVIYRLKISESLEGHPRRNPAFGGILRGRSFCPHCKHVLSWQDLIPVFSFLFLKGKCRYCQKPISLQYPLVEIATGMIFVLILLTVSNVYTMVYFLLISCFLIIIFIYDLKHCIIPDKVIYPAILVSGVWYLASGIFFDFYTKYPAVEQVHYGAGEMLNTICSAIGAATFFLLIVLVSRGRWMGAGDIKLAFLMGLFLGWPNILTALFLAFFIGAITGVGLIIFNKKTLKSEIPFGPFLVGGTFIALFLGERIIDCYLTFFLL